VKNNIALIIPQLRHGGAERVVSRLSKLLCEKFNVYIVVFDDKAITYSYSGTLHSLKAESSLQQSLLKKFFFGLKRIVEYTKFKKRFNINLSFSFGDTANLVNILTPGRDKKIVSIRGYKRIRKAKNLKTRLFLKPISKFIVKKADKVVVVSRKIYNDLIKEYKVKKDNILILYNGYDLDEIYQLSKLQLDLIHNDIFKRQTIISIGTHRSEKGFCHLVKSFKLIHEKLPYTNLVIIGADYNNNKVKIEKLINDLKLQNNVFLIDYQENIFNFLTKSSVYALSSINEGFPNALVEAMICGLPIVATDCDSGPREILCSGLNSDMPCINDFKVCDFGILTNKLSNIEDYNPDNITREEKNFSLAIIEILTKKDLSSHLRFKAKQRSLNFDQLYWFNAITELFNELGLKDV